MSFISGTNEKLSDLVAEAERLGVHGLLFQHVRLCETRAWLHYQRIDCAHLNRHMRMGLVVHELHYSGQASGVTGLGIAPDRLDMQHLEVWEVKRSNSHESATLAQLAFYVAVLRVNTGQPWQGVLRYPGSRRTKKLQFDGDAKRALFRDFEQIRQIISQPQPPASQRKPLCPHCSYRMVCWQQGTEEGDFS